MKYLTVFAVLIAVTGVNVVCRNGLYNPAAASRGPDRAARSDRAIGIDGVAPIDRGADKAREPIEGAGAPVSRCAVDLSRETARDGDVALARIAAECGNHLFEKSRAAPDNPHLLPQAAQHYRACLAHEPTSPDAGALFRDVRARLEQVERLLAQPRRAARPIERKRTAPPDSPRPSAPPEERTGVESKPTEEARPAPVETEAEEKDEGKMVGPDGVIYQRRAKR